jgi:hypothetical protein
VLVIPKGKIPVITDPDEARQALVDDVLRRAKQARSHFQIAPKEKRTNSNGRVYPSLREKRNHEGLETLEKIGEIEDLQWQVPFDIYHEGQWLARYVADHVYFDKKLGRKVVADSKGKRTPLFILKKRLMKIFLNIDVVEM